MISEPLRGPWTGSQNALHFSQTQGALAWSQKDLEPVLEGPGHGLRRSLRRIRSEPIFKDPGLVLEGLRQV